MHETTLKKWGRVFLEENTNFEIGWSSPLWMARALIWNADEKLLRLAVDQVMRLLWTQDEEELDPSEVFEVLVQVCATGKYSPVELTQKHYEEVMRLADGILQKSEDDEVEKFRREMDEFLGGESDDNT